MLDINQKTTIFALIYLGIFSLIAQVILIRELIISFYGNELFIGLVLGSWLVSTGIGSLWLAGIASPPAPFLGRERGDQGRLFWLYLFIPLIFAGAIILARLARVVLGQSGIMPNLFGAMGWSLLVIAPLGLLLGAQFVALARNLKPDKSQAVSLAYIIESIGFFLGAILFNFILFKLASLLVIGWLAILGFIIVLLFSFKQFKLRVSVIIAILIIVLGLGLGQANSGDKQLHRWHYPGEDLLTAINTKYGTVEATRINEQINFYYNGHLLDNSQNKYHNELITHLPLLMAENPKSVLVIGNAFSGIINELDKYNLEEIVYLELDKDYLNLARQLGLAIGTGVKVVHQDAREYLSKTNKNFDVVIINYSNPSTLSENRYFTREFFRLVNSHLSREGIVAIKLDTTPNYIVGAQNKLLSIVYVTLKDVYTNVYTLPDNEVVFLAGQGKLALDWQALQKKYLDLNLDNKYIIPQFVEWRFENDRAQKLSAQLAGSQVKSNSDFKPTLYYQQLKIFLEKMQIKKWLWGISIIPAILLILFILLIRKSRLASRKLLFISAIPEFCLMSFEVLLILLFQTFYGYLYTQLSLIIALVLLGIALGSFAFSKLLAKMEANKLLKLSYLIVVAVFAVVFLLTWQFSAVFNYKFIYYILSILAGFAIGTKFPIINKLYLKNSSRIGAVYGVDLIGGAVGALLAGIFMLPVLGVVGSLGVMAGLCVSALILIYYL